MILTEYNKEEHMAALKEYYEEQIEKAVAKSEKRANDAETKLDYLFSLHPTYNASVSNSESRIK